MRNHPVAVGDLVLILPAHSCLAVQALGQYLTMEGHKIRTLLKPYAGELYADDQLGE